MNPNYIKAAIRSMEKRPFRVSLGGLNPTGAGVTRNNHWGEPEYIGKCHRQNWYSKQAHHAPTLLMTVHLLSLKPDTLWKRH